MIAHTESGLLSAIAHAFLMIVKYWLALVPFIGFGCGYYVVSRVMQPHFTVAVPGLVGRDLQAALLDLSSSLLYGRLIEERDDAARPEGTIIAQHPTAGQQVRPYQTVDLTVVKKKAPIEAPACTGKSYRDVEVLCASLGIQSVPVVIEHERYPVGTVIAQSPSPGTVVDKQIMVYVACRTMWYLMPSLLGKTIDEGVALCRKQGIEPTLMGNHAKFMGHIVAQRPYPGTVLDITKKIDVQLMIGI